MRCNKFHKPMTAMAITATAMLAGCSAYSTSPTAHYSGGTVGFSVMSSDSPYGPSLVAGDSLAYQMMLAGGFGPSLDGARYATVETNTD